MSDKKHRCHWGYRVNLEYSNLTTKELAQLIELDLGEMKHEVSYGEFVKPEIDRMYKHYDDGWEEPIDDRWKLTYKIESCARIMDKECCYDNIKGGMHLAEKVASYIYEKTGIE